MDRKIKQIAFNLTTERELLELAETMPNFSGWVKDKLREDIYKTKFLGKNLSAADKQLAKTELHSEPANLAKPEIAKDYSSFI